MISNGKIILLGILTILVFPLVGFILFWVLEGNYQTFLQIFESKIGLHYEFIIGVSSGFLFGFMAWWLIKSEMLKPVLEKYGNVIQSLKMNYFSVVFVSICAGVGEEVFFRGVLQDYLGVIVTAVIFVAIHGYISFKDWRISIYGIYLTFAIIIIGYMDYYFGLTTAMVAHTCIDIVLFYKLTHTKISEHKVYFEL